MSNLKEQIISSNLPDEVVIADARFNRFDQELIDKYFNEEGKEAIRQYVTQSNKDLLERVRSEVLKTPECNCKHAREMVKPQRSALQKIEDSLDWYAHK